MKKAGRMLFAAALLTVLVLGVSVATSDSAQAFEYFDSCPTNICGYSVSTAGVCDGPNGENCIVRREYYGGSYCLGNCF